MRGASPCTTLNPRWFARLSDSSGLKNNKLARQMCIKSAPFKVCPIDRLNTCTSVTAGTGPGSENLVRSCQHTPRALVSAFLKPVRQFGTSLPT
eukprot:9495661-Pyramimonas_sp.AAC.1